MSDLAFQLLRQQLNNNTNKNHANTNNNSLWIVDENLSVNDIVAVHSGTDLLAMTNRCDVSAVLSKKGFKTLLVDFDFSGLEPHSLDAIYYRISKEKAVVHHIINSAAIYLKPDGLFYLAGYKNEGTKTYINKAAKYLGELVEKERGGNASMLAAIRPSAIDDRPLDDKNYRQLVSVSDDNTSFVSKPGVYGWNKIDKGSAFLIEHLGSFTQALDLHPERIADLGCGYGYLSVMANQQLQAEYIATDNNVAAVTLCNKNFVSHQLKGQAVLTDCGSEIEGKFDIVLCNPPFHQGFDVDTDLGLKFLEGAKRLLVKGGSALFVVNSFIPLEKKALGLFSEVSVLANNGSFKLLSLNISA
ncbi:MAG: methyltransferase [Pseudomonadales bacterium]